jgi:hypothetical protein
MQRKTIPFASIPCRCVMGVNLIQQHTEAFYPGFPAPVKTVTTLTNFYAHRGELH